jgi:hypothetical protein
MLTCRRLRSVVLASAILLIVGILTEIGVQTTPLGAPSVTPALLSALAAFLVLLAATLLAVTFLVSLLPGMTRQLGKCQH